MPRNPSGSARGYFFAIAPYISPTILKWNAKGEPVSLNSNRINKKTVAALACPAADAHWVAGGSAPLYSYAPNFYLACDTLSDSGCVRKISQIVRPSFKIMNIDASRLVKSASDNILDPAGGYTRFATTSWPVMTGNREMAARFRHSSKAQIVFTDGHCGGLVRNDLAGGKGSNKHILPKVAVWSN